MSARKDVNYLKGLLYIFVYWFFLLNATPRHCYYFNPSLPSWVLFLSLLLQIFNILIEPYLQWSEDDRYCCAFPYTKSAFMLSEWIVPRACYNIPKINVFFHLFAFSCIRQYSLSIRLFIRIVRSLRFRIVSSSRPRLFSMLSFHAFIVRRSYIIFCCVVFFSLFISGKMIFVVCYV